MDLSGNCYRFLGSFTTLGKLSISTKLRIYSTCVLPILLYGSETWTLIQADWKRLDSFHVRCQRRILHIRWHDFVSNEEVLSRTGLFDVSYVVRKRRLGLFGHVARLRSDVPANQILRICTKTRDGDRPSQEWRRGRPPTTWIHQICRDTGVTATEALQLAEDRPFPANNRNGGRLRLIASRHYLPTYLYHLGPLNIQKHVANFLMQLLY